MAGQLYVFPLCYKSRMRTMLSGLFLLLFCSSQSILAELNPSWTTAIVPFRITDNLYYVGSEHLASYLVVTPKGNILINANLDSSPPQIRASVEKLGFHWGDTRILLNSQAHYDHTAGAAEVVRETHAKNMVMDGDVSVVETGALTDFLSPSPNIHPYAPVPEDRVLHDGDSVTLGDVTLTAHKTAGHTKGTTTWTLNETDHGKTLHVVIVGSPNVNPGYKLVGNKTYSQIADDYRHGFQVLQSLPCDIFLGAHGGYFGMKAKYERWKGGNHDAFIDPEGYKHYIADREQAFEAEFKKQLSPRH